jgi:uncharacterized protein (DUF1778 family)
LASCPETVQPRDVWVADRNFCTTDFLFGIARRDGCVVIRQHGATLFIESMGQRRRCGQGETGAVFKQEIQRSDGHGQTMKVRRITVELDTPARDGETEVRGVAKPLPDAQAGPHRKRLHLSGELPYNGRAKRGRMMPRAQNRTARIEARLTPDALADVKRAAELEGRSVSDFVVAAAQQAARQTIEQAHLIRLSIEDQERFVDLLLNPPPPSPALERAQKAHSRLIRESR